jgi:hypothetical protein
MSSSKKKGTDLETFKKINLLIWEWQDILEDINHIENMRALTFISTMIELKFIS